MIRRVLEQGTSTVDEVREALRERILSGDLPGGERLREVSLADGFGVARHTVRAALQKLAAEGLVRVERNRGARVAELDREEIQQLYELRCALEIEAARLALARGGGRLPPSVHAAVDRLRATCATPQDWRPVVEAHYGVHAAIVAASRSERIIAAHRAIGNEMLLFAVALRDIMGGPRMVVDHERLIADLEAEGPHPLRVHLERGASSLLDRAYAQRQP